MSSAAYFPFAPQREVLDFVIGSFPFPLALTYARLQKYMDRQDPVAAVWQLRDAFESLLRFTASLAAADVLQTHPLPEETSDVVATLLYPKGLSLGHFTGLLSQALVPLKPLARLNRLRDCGRHLPELYTVFFDPAKGRPTDLGRKILTENNLVNWRNRVFGHGVFKQERQWYADETLEWMNLLHDFYRSLRPVLEGWVLTGLTPRGEQVVWQGAAEVPVFPWHAHKPQGDLLPLFLIPTESVLRRDPHSSSLSLAPLLVVQKCALCKQPSVFFFDKYQARTSSPITVLLEYSCGAHAETKDWEAARKLAALAPSGFQWQRTSYDRDEVAERLRAVFRDFEQEYIRPSYALDVLWKLLNELPRGYLHIVGPAGIGKTYLVRGLEREGQDRGVTVLRYHIQSGALSDYRTFMSELADRARDRLRFRTQEVQTLVGSSSKLSEQLTLFLTEVMRANCLDRLVLVLDGLDMLPAPEPSSVTITELLPPAGQLPRGCCVVLTSRESMHGASAVQMERLRQAAPFTLLPLRPESPANQDLLRDYLRVRLSEQFRRAEDIEEVLSRSSGVFLSAFHLCRALAAGAFRNVYVLPPAGQFYPAYLDHLCEQVGRSFFEAVHLRLLLLLAVARRPVNVRQLQRWGVPGERLRCALLDLSDFLRAHRGPRPNDSLADDPDEPCYEIAHEAFREFLRTDPNLSGRWQAAHVVIARSALEGHQGRWKELDPTDDADLYDLRFILAHLDAAGLSDEGARLFEQEGYFATCMMVGQAACSRAHRFQVALDLFDVMLQMFERLPNSSAGNRLGGQAGALGLRATALRMLGRLPEALVNFAQAINLLRSRCGKKLDEGSREELTHAILDQGIILTEMERLDEAIKSYDEAIEFLQSMVKKSIRRTIVKGRIVKNERLSIPKRLPDALMEKGSALAEMGQHESALACHDQAVAAYRILEGVPPGELMIRLAAALRNKGITLYKLQRFKDALDCYDEAIGIRRQLIVRAEHVRARALTSVDFPPMLKPMIQKEGLPEDFNDLAGELMEKGLALKQMQRLQEAQSCLEEAAVIHRRQVDEEGHIEWERHLAGALMNLGTVLEDQKRFSEAIGRYEEAVARFRRLAGVNGQPELVRYLASALTNKGRVLEAQGHWAEALGCYDEAAQLWEQRLKLGMNHLLPDLLINLSHRLALLLKQQAWDRAAANIVRALEHLTSREELEPLEALIGQFIGFLRPLRDLDKISRLQVVAQLGKWEPAVSAWGGLSAWEDEQPQP